MNEQAIRQTVADGKMNAWEAAWLILELRQGSVNTAHPDDQEAAKDIHASLIRP